MLQGDRSETAPTRPSLREALLREAVDGLPSNDVDTGQSLIRDYVNATIGFGETPGIDGQVSPKA